MAPREHCVSCTLLLLGWGPQGGGWAANWTSLPCGDIHSRGDIPGLRAAAQGFSSAPLTEPHKSHLPFKCHRGQLLGIPEESGSWFFCCFHVGFPSKSLQAAACISDWLPGKTQCWGFDSNLSTESEGSSVGLFHCPGFVTKLRESLLPRPAWMGVSSA